MSSFPQELVELIIDEASDDIMALRSCSLVALSFLPRTRVYLFEIIELNTAAECQKFHDLCIASPYLIRYFKELRIIHYNDGCIPVFGDTSFPALMSLVPVETLERLKIVACDWRFVSDASKQALSLQSFRSVVPGIEPRPQSRGPVHCIRRSKELDLSFKGIAEESQAPILNPPAPGTSPIKTNLEGYCDPILQSIVRTQKYPFSVSNLQTLSISLQHRSTAVLLTEFLDLELPSLENLNVVDQMLFLGELNQVEPYLQSMWS